jgi:hypothetical protein
MTPGPIRSQCMLRNPTPTPPPPGRSKCKKKNLAWFWVAMTGGGIARFFHRLKEPAAFIIFLRREMRTGGRGQVGVGDDG